jgi:uncharacterized protein YjdB
MRLTTNIYYVLHALYIGHVRQHMVNKSVCCNFAITKKIMKYLALTVFVLAISISSFAQVGAITGTLSLCDGSTTTLNDTTSGGSWSSSNPGIASIGATSGILTAVSAGVVTVTYTAGSYVTANVTVNPMPGAITGSSSVCIGSATTLICGTAGGSWSSSAPAIATVSSLGVVSGVVPGTASIMYTMPGGCSSVTPMTVNITPGPISGPSSMCPGSTIPMFDPAPGGGWTSSNAAIATVGFTTGAVTGVGTGAATITYSLPTGCYSIAPVTVNFQPAAITGPASACVGILNTLSDVTPGGMWTINPTSVATIGGTTGFITGISAGTAYATYTLSSGCSTSRSFVVNPSPAAITGTAFMVCEGGSIFLNDATSPGTFSASPSTWATVSPGGIVTGLMAGSQNITYTESVHSCYTIKTITVNAAPALSSISTTGATSFCAGGIGVPLALSGSQTGVNYQLYLGSAPFGPSVSGTGSSMSMGNATLPGNYTAVGTSAASACSVNMVGSVAVSMNPTPVAYSVTGGGPYCSGGTGVNVGLSNSNLGVNYQLFLGGTPVGSYVAGTGSSISFGPHTAGGSYTVLASYPITGCNNNMTGSANITINPMPTTYTVSGGGAFCAGTSGVHIGLGGSNTGVQYQLFRGTAPFGTPLAGTGVALDFGIINASGTYTVVASNLATSCSQLMSGAAVITASPLPRADTVMSTTSSYCSGGPGVDVTLSGSQGGVSYQLMNGSTAIGSAILGSGASISFGPQTAGTYNVIATNTATGCINNMIGPDIITRLPSPTIFTVTGGGNICTGGTTGVPIGLSASQYGINYQLYLGGAPLPGLFPGTGGVLAFGLYTTAGTYTVKAVNSTTGCSSTMAGSATVVINPLPVTFAVTGGGSYCMGGTGVRIGLSSSATGIIYQLFNGTVTVGVPVPGTGSTLDFGLQTTGGTYTVVATDAATSCTRNMGGSANVLLNTLPVPYSVTGGGSYCPGTGPVHIGLSSSNSGISYQLYNGTVPEGTVSGTGAAIDFGVYTAGGAYTVVATNSTTGCVNNMTGSATITITTPIVPSVSITASTPDTICAGSTTTFTAIPVNGGTTPNYAWAVNGVIAAVGNTYSYVPANGDIVSVRMTSSAACAMPLMVTSTPITMAVYPTPVITGLTTLCVGASTVFSSTTGSVWTSSTPSVAVVATIGVTTGVVTGMSAGSAVITCALGSCYATTTVTINTTPIVTASSVASCGGINTLTASGAANYSWLPTAGLSCPLCAATTAQPGVTTTYTVTGSFASGCSGTARITVNANRISGYISYLGTAPNDTFKVWLIQFNPSDSSLTAEDSTFSCKASGTPYFEFNGKPNGSYMVKARLLSAIPGNSGYIPTYSLSTPHWYDAASITHTGNSDSMHINMVYGIVPAGNGFIGGYISAGAGKGTSGAAPAPGMLVYLKDAISNFVLSYTYTDADGAYSFSHIGDGSYIIYPEEYSYNTTPSAVLVLGGTTDSINEVNFREYTISKAIRPIVTTGVVKIGPSNGTMSIYPNPTNGAVNIKWANQPPGAANVMLTDVTGRTVYNGTVTIDNSGATLVNPGNLKSGMYMLTVKSDRIYYSWKVQVME